MNNKVILVSLLMIWPPAYCGGEGAFPLRRSPGATDLNEITALKAEIEILKADLAEAKAEVTADDAKSKRTDVQKIMGDQADQPQDTMDMVVTCVTVDGVKKDMHCDVPGCSEIAHNIWFSVDTGIMFKRCDKHKDGVVVK